MDGFLTIRGVTRTFGNVVAVDSADLDVANGEIVALLGPSGCGKTTLLRLVGGLEVPNSGRIVLDGRVLNDGVTMIAPERRGVAMVFQDFALFPHMNVASNVAFGLPRGANRKARVADLLELVGLPGLARRYPHELSGGQQQRVALARALASEPRLILLDEPFSNLDPTVRLRVREEVRRLIQGAGITAIFVTHDQDEALSLADRVAVMIAGKILRTGTPQEVYEDPRSPEVARFIGEPNLLPGEVHGGCVNTELGRFPVCADFDGAARVMVRPEEIVRVDSGGGIEGEVIGVAYFGHDFLVSLRLASGLVVRARWHGVEPQRVGDRICIAVEGTVLAFRRG